MSTMNNVVDDFFEEVYREKFSHQIKIRFYEAFPILLKTYNTPKFYTYKSLYGEMMYDTFNIFLWWWKENEIKYKMNLL